MGAVVLGRPALGVPMPMLAGWFVYDDVMGSRYVLRRDTGEVIATVTVNPDMLTPEMTDRALDIIAALAPEPPRLPDGPPRLVLVE